MDKRTRPVETPEQAIHRLAELAEERGIQIFSYERGAISEYYATSHSRPGALHRVTAYSCDCPGFFRNQRCSHHAALLAAIGELPPLPPTPTPEQQAARITERAAAMEERDPYAMTPKHAAHIETQARAWLTSLITRQDRGEVVPESHIREATAAVALYAELSGDGLPLSVAA